MLALAAIGALILILGVFSNPLRRRVPVSPPLVALLLGIVLGPHVLGWLDPGALSERDVLLREAARVTLAIGLMAIALRLPPRYLLRHWRSLALILGVVMPLMWIFSGLLVYLLIGLPFWIALLVGAALTPTDPIVSTSIVVGDFAEEHLPARLRHTISAEAGANDGLAYPLLVLPVLFMAASPADVLGRWLVHTWLWEVGGAIVIGIAVGAGAGKLLMWSERLDLIETHSFLAYTLALTLFTLGVAELAGTEGIMAVFLAGLAFDWVVGSKERSEEERVQETVNQFFFLPVFGLLGLTLPWSEWFELGWPALALVGSVLLLRRLPAVLLLAPWVGRLKTRGDALYFGWFGPIGVSTLLYAMLAVERTGAQEVWALASLLLFASVLVHGVTANPLTIVYGRRARRGMPDR